jgi:hypothetical protein
MAFAHHGAIDILCDGAGELIPPADRPLSRWVEAAGRLLDDPLRAEDMAARGSRLARERFAWRTKAELLVARLARLGDEPASEHADESTLPRPELS